MILRAFSSFSTQERLFIFCAMICGFFISADYAIIRPVSNAVFLTAYGTSALPYAWLATIPVNLWVVSLYNKYLPKVGCFKMFLLVAAGIVSMNLFCGLFLRSFSWLPFLFYVGKEIYIMLMFQQLWSVIHSTVSVERAKYLYGPLFGIGGCGAILGSLVPGFLARKIGSESLLFATLPLYLLLGVAYFFTIKTSGGKEGLSLEKEVQKSSLEAFWHGMRLIANSRYLLFILSIVVLMQVSSSIIDYQFNSLLEKTVLDKDLRTQFTGRILSIVHSVTLALQFVGSFLLIQFLGVKRSHFLVPLLLFINSITFHFFPLFSVISIGYITAKSCDFSLFVVIKELLYIPLKPDEKFRAKAVIDVFAYRSSKALASFLILSVNAIGIIHFSMVLNFCSLVLLVLWLFIVSRMLSARKYSKF